MTYNIPEWFIPKYSDEVKIRAQQKRRKLDGVFEDGGMFVGDFYYTPRFGSVETYKANRFDALRLANAAMDWVKQDCEPEFAAFGVWDPDQNKLNISMAGQFAGATVKAVNRARDRQTIDALKDAAANGVQNTKGDAAEQIATIGNYNTVATLETICEAIADLGTNEMFESETVSLILPFKVNVNLSLDPYLAKSEMKNNRVWDQVQFRTYEKLPGNGPNGEGWLAGGATGVDMFIVAQSAGATAQNDDDTEINERMGSQLGTMIGRWFQAGAKVIEPKGVIRIKSKLDFALMRQAIPIIDVAV